MHELPLPSSLSSLVEKLQVVQFYRRNIPIQLPKFAVYAVLDQPVFDKFVYREKRKIGLIRLGKYLVPVIDPFRGELEELPEHVVVISQHRGNKFGLFGYPADDVVYDVELPFYHRSVRNIVKDFVTD
ncbi:MAG: hypothetical protein GJ680_20310 [Alteromonadaceae bacterium]|nr:hypothetical protein [Alteromonadaceae bacterium]